MNVFDDVWDEAPYPTPPGWEQRTKALLPRGGRLGMRLYELPPGQTQVVYHFHHGNDEAVVVLQGRPTVRTPEGERELEPGEVVFFPTGPDGAHQLFNRSDEPARYLIAASHVSPEVVEYPDSGKVLALSQVGPLWTMHRRADAVDYFDGEEPRA
ncbi:MAG TPA: cupin domain-containing protein [Gaiellaceae bacterium]|nr:cupin domain-containing protein [Gaiellaceae bacterium]